jgi:pyrrolidone-carboxylate peptidase
MPEIALVAFGPAPWAPVNTAVEIVDTLAAQRWMPDLARLRTGRVASLWSLSVGALREVVGAARVVLLLESRPQDTAVSVSGWAHNAADWRSADSSGVCWPGPRLMPRGADALDAGVDAGALARAAASEGVAAQIAVRPPALVANRCLFSLAAEGNVRAALVGVPLPMEACRGEPRAALAPNRLQILLAVQAMAEEACRLRFRADDMATRGA